MKSDFSGPASDEENAEGDSGCAEFSDAIRAAGTNTLPATEEWDSDHGLFAKMLLCDQLSRNAFRGTSEAFAFDKVGMSACRELFRREAHVNFDSTTYFTFFTTPPQHSEELEDHEMNETILEFAQAKFPDDPTIAQTGVYITQHASIIKKWGRYPWRNAALSRENTPEEQAYLDDYDNLPNFAKSQLPRPK